jgi:peptidoglycan/LPS O-acetylase OafA/YrhL
VSEFGWAPAIGLGITLPALLLPNGHLRSRRWRLVVITSVTGFVLATVGGALAPGPLEELGIDNPLGLAGPAGDVASVLTIVGVLLHWWSLPPAAVCVILRFRSSRGVERQQMRWVAAGAAGAVAGLLLSLPSGLGIAPDFVSHIVYPALLLPPVAIGVAVLRYRLYDLDRVISRTLTYGLLTVLLGLGYAGVVLGLGRLLPEGSSLIVAAATLATVAAFSPLRRRVQALVDRRFNRRRYDAARTVEGFATRLRDQVDLDALHGELLAVVDQTMQPTRASLWLRPAP